MSDIIRLNGITFYGYHGVLPAEKETGRMFEIDCELETDLSAGAKSDKLADTVDYQRIHSLIRETAEGKIFTLLEGIAGRLAEKILAEFPITRVTLKVRKLHPPIGGHVKSVEVELTRYRAGCDNGKSPDMQADGTNGS